MCLLTRAIARALPAESIAPVEPPATQQGLSPEEPAVSAPQAAVPGDSAEEGKAAEAAAEEKQPSAEDAAKPAALSAKAWQVECIHILSQVTFDTADGVHDMRVVLDHTVRRHLHCTRDRHATQIIARQIDEHHVFRLFLRICE